MAAVSRRGRSFALLSNLPSWLTHLLAMIAGALTLGLYQSMGQLTQNTAKVVTLAPSVAPLLTSSPTTLSPTSLAPSVAAKKEEFFDVLPMMALEHEIHPKDLRTLITEVQTRILFKSELKTGPFWIYYPSAKPNIAEYLEREARDLPNVFWKVIPHTEDRKQVLLSKEIWNDLQSKAEKILGVDISSVLCSNPTHTVAWWTPQFDWIGALWDWARDPQSRHHKGGNGALSIRSPKHLYQILLKWENDHPGEKPNGNEDMFFVSQLRDWEESGEDRNGVKPPQLPLPETQTKFAVEVVPSPHDHVPTGIYHKMIVMDHKERERMIESCPEIKRMFPSFHEPTCVQLECPKNMTYNLFNWNAKKEEEGENFDKCAETCHVYYHPVAQTIQSWNETYG